VYKISCKNCDAIYVGQTKRKLNIRISEHQNQFNRKSINTTVIMNIDCITIIRF